MPTFECHFFIIPFFFAFWETDYLPLTVLIEDINDHHPQFWTFRDIFRQFGAFGAFEDIWGHLVIFGDI